MKALDRDVDHDQTLLTYSHINTTSSQAAIGSPGNDHDLALVYIKVDQLMSQGSWRFSIVKIKENMLVNKIQKSYPILLA